MGFRSSEQMNCSVEVYIFDILENNRDDCRSTVQM